MKILKWCLVIIFISSCKNESSVVGASELEGSEVKTEIKIPQNITLLDTLYGEVFFTSAFDTIKMNKDDQRFIQLYLKIFQKTGLTSDKVNIVAMDTFARIHKSKIPIYGISFKDTGEYFLEGYIEDLYLKYLKEDPDNAYEVKSIGLKITHKINVIE